jgi:hypothetical protein
LLGPQRLAGAALHTERLTQRIGEALREFQSAAQLRDGAGTP